MPNLLQDNIQKSEDDMIENEVLIASCDNSESSPITPAEHENKGNAHDAILTKEESSLDVLNFSTNHAMIEQILVEPSLDLPLSQDDLLAILGDKDDLHDDNYVIPMQSLKNDHYAIYVLKLNTCAENRLIIHNASDVDELKLLSSLNTLGYIEFDVLCNLNYLEKKLYAYADLPWLSRHTYLVFGKYSDQGQYRVPRVYICTNLNSSFVVQNNDQLEDYKINNVVMLYSSSFALQSQVESKEGEHMFLVSTNLLQDNIDKDRVHFNRGDYMFVGEGMLQTESCGHILSPNNVNSKYFSNLVCLHVVQNGLKQHRRRGRLFIKKGRMMRTCAPCI
jgi:hypothetical protein